MGRKRRSIVFREHARERAQECGVDVGVLRKRIGDLAPRLRPFAGFLAGTGRVALMQPKAPSPVVRVTGRGIEVITVLRPGQEVIRSDTMAVRV